MKTSLTTIIDAPAALVFLWLDDNERLLKWVPNLIKDEALTDMPGKVGSTFAQTFLENGREMEMEGEITAFEENERMRVYMKNKMFELDVDYHLKALSETQTEVTQHTKIYVKGFMKLLFPLMGLMSKMSKKDPQADAHARLKACVEAEYRSANV